MSRNNDVDHVLVSQGTRSDAKPVQIGNRLETLSEEYDRLRVEKLELERELRDYGVAAFAKAQLIFRRDNPRSKPQDWIMVRTEMQEKKQRLSDRLSTIQKRMVAIGERVRQESGRVHALKRDETFKSALMESVALQKETNRLLAEILCILSSRLNQPLPPPE